MVQEAYREYRHMADRRDQQAQRLAQVDSQTQARQAMLQRMQGDPAHLERIVRERLRFAKPGEIIFVFPEEDNRIVD